MSDQPTPSPSTSTPPTTTLATDPELADEREHLAESRDALRRMRTRAEGLDTSASAGDWVSQKYLQSTLSIRIDQLADRAGTPLFFGRLDYEPSSAQSGESFHVGRRHVADDDGDALVVDWRAPVSVPFYRATARDPLGVHRRRRFGFAGAALTSYEDEVLGGVPRDAAVDTTISSQILTTEIERPRVGPMRDIVATIQPDQDVIVRADIADSVCVQGAPGTGKTAVGLHRAAFLLYSHRDQLARQRLLVIGPNAAFLRYIGQVLPALGEVDASQTTIHELVGHVRVRGTDDTAAAVLKGDARMAELLERTLWRRLRPPTEALVVTRGSRRFRVPAYEITENVDALRERGVRYTAGRGLLPQRLAHAVLLRMEADGDSPDDRVQDAVARTREVKACVEAVWPAVRPEQVLHELYTDADLRAEVAGDLLDSAEQELLTPTKPARSAGSARWTTADAVLVDEVVDLLERTPSLGHVVLDEAQDLSPMQLRAVGRRCSTGSVTVLGDLAQGTTPWAAGSWPEALGHLGKPGATVEELTLGFRVPGAVIDFAARLLPSIAPTLAPPRSVRRSRGELRILPVGSLAAVRARLATRTAELLDGQPGSVGVIVPDATVDAVHAAFEAAGIVHARTGDADDVEARCEVVPAGLAKGLEFDHVVLAEPADLVAAEADARTGLRRLYVCLTRAVSSLTIVHRQPLPPELGDPEPADWHVG